MFTTINKLIDPIMGLPSATKGILCSFGLHAAVLAASYTWWSSPIAPVSFAGNRHTVQIEASYSELPSERELEALLEYESFQSFSPRLEEEINDAPPRVDLTPMELPRSIPELMIVPSALELPDIPLQEEDAHKISEVQRPPSPEPVELTPIETVKKPQNQPKHPPTPQTSSAVEQPAGVDEQRPPDLTGNQPPSYPAEAIRRRLEGVVMLRVRITAEGHVERVEITKSSGHAILDRTAVEAVSTWHARPAEQDGKPVATVEMLPIYFQL